MSASQTPPMMSPLQEEEDPSPMITIGEPASQPRREAGRPVAVPVIHHAIARAIRPPSSGKPGIRLKSEDQHVESRGGEHRARPRSARVRSNASAS